MHNRVPIIRIQIQIPSTKLDKQIPKHLLNPDQCRVCRKQSKKDSISLTFFLVIKATKIADRIEKSEWQTLWSPPPVATLTAPGWTSMEKICKPSCLIQLGFSAIISMPLCELQDRIFEQLNPAQQWTQNFRREKSIKKPSLLQFNIKGMWIAEPRMQLWMRSSNLMWDWDLGFCWDLKEEWVSVGSEWEKFKRECDFSVYGN